MTTYIILDASGSRKGTIKAENKLDALKKYLGVHTIINQKSLLNWFVIPEDIMFQFQDNVNRA